MCELLTVSSLQAQINSTSYSFLHTLPAKLPNLTGDIYLRKIILLDVTTSEPFSLECSLVEKTITNPTGTLGIFYGGPKTSEKPQHICIINQNALPMSMVSTPGGQELDTVTISVTALKEKLVCVGIIVEFLLDYEC